MRLHRFYVGDSLKITHDFWINDQALLHQWQKVFRLTAGAEVVLFDGKEHDRLYQFTKLDKNGAHLKHITDLDRSVPKQNVYLLWSLLKKDKNDWVLQKATELGASHFWPVISERGERKDIDEERSQKIIIEAAEQCGRSDIPTLRPPELLKTAINNFRSEGTLYVCQQGEALGVDVGGVTGLLIGPEGGWSDNEKELFKAENLTYMGLGDFTLRAETAAIAATTKVSGM